MADVLIHYGVKGMKWGIRRKNQERMTRKAERKLGRKLKWDDFGGSTITNKGIKNVKKYDEQEARYKQVKKKSDPAYDYMRGHDPFRYTQVSHKQMDKIIKKLEKDPSLSALDLQNAQLDKNVRVRKGKQVANSCLNGVMTGVTIGALYYYMR